MSTLRSVSATFEKALACTSRTLEQYDLSLRELGPEDYISLMDLVDNMSEQSRYTRFHSGLTTLPEHFARDLANCDGVTKVAYGAFDKQGRLVAEARYALNNPCNPEFAVMVIDEHHRKGLGTLLGILVATHAKEMGHLALCADILSSNPAALAVVTHLGEVEFRSWSGAVGHYHIHLV